ncbi:MAG: TVP38/TMEM64 family protein [Deltaproteobacteria bacterium]|nr:TVP38/TMEM64 family protein [Deltaproteobacteria bacterium]MBW2400769.1 TVP38/TMEM64 family protein [Deltaproteobacteria bacterium]MBW2665502.1 TVP38/TMEM64 family protein [Deltaproteobacteria bacterium]
MKRVAIAMVLLLVVAAIAIVTSGRVDEFANAEQMAALLDRAGPLGPILFIALIVALFPVFLIGPPIWASLALWPAPLAILYSSIGCFTASVIFYALARSFGQEWAQPRIPDKIRKYEDRLVEHPFRTIVVMRLLIWANPAVDLLIGVSRVRPRDYLLATAVGLLPSTAAQILIVGTGLGMALELPKEIWFTAGIAIGVLLLVRTLRKRRSAATDTES